MLSGVLEALLTSIAGPTMGNTLLGSRFKVLEIEAKSPSLMVQRPLTELLPEP